MNLKSFKYNHISDTDRRLLADLLRSVWKDMDTKEIHPQEMDAVSFCAVSDNIFIGYVGVIKWTIRIGDKTFSMCGLSCVCTHPAHRKHGVASGLVRKATEWILQNGMFCSDVFFWNMAVFLNKGKAGALHSGSKVTYYHLIIFSLLYQCEEKGNHPIRNDSPKMVTLYSLLMDCSF